MPGEVIDTAFVEIRPLLSPGFAAQAEAGIASELGAINVGAVEALGGGLNTVSAASEKVVLTGDAAAAAFSGMGVAAEKSAGMVEAASAKSTVSVEESARLKIAATVKERAELALLAAEYETVAAASTSSAEQQVAAARLAEAANAKLAASGAIAGEARAAGLAGVAGGGLAGGLKGFAGITAAAFGVVELTKKLREGVEIAGHLEKSGEAIGIEFGASAGDVIRFAKSAQSLGISAVDSEALSVRIGILSHNLHIAQPEAAHMAVNLQELAGSIAEIRGIDPSTVLANLPQALAGNLRSLKQLGFAFSNVQIEQEAVRLGALKTGQTLTPTAKAIGVYGLLVQQLGFYQQQAAKHSGDLVNQEHRLSAQTSNTEGAIGSLVKGPLAKVVGGLADAEEATGKWITGLEHNKGLMKDFDEAGAAVGQSLHLIGEGFRIVYELGKPVLDLLGITLVLALKAGTKGLEAFNFVLDLEQKAFKFTVGIIIDAIDKFLGAFSFLASVVNKVLPGNPLGGAQKSIDSARDKLRAFKDDLDGIDGKHVTTTIDVNISKPLNDIYTDIFSGTKPIGRRAAGQGNSGEIPKPLAPTQDLPVLSQRKEQRLQDQVSLAAAKNDVEAQKAALAELEGFYKTLATRQTFSVALRRSLRVQAAQAQAQIDALNSQEASDAKTARDKNVQAAKDRAEAAYQERLGIAQANLRLAESTTGTLADDVRAEIGLVKVLNARVASFRKGTADRRAAQADLTDAQNQVKTLRAEEVSNTLAAREDLLKDNLTLAQFSKPLGDDRRALNALEQFYAARVAESKAGSVARRKWKIELERTKAEIADLDKTAKETSAAEKKLFTEQSYSFLTEQQGFAANLASNLIGDTHGLVGGTGPAAPTPILPSLPKPIVPLPAASALASVATREAGGRPPSGTQLDQLIQLTRESLVTLRLIRAGSAHPEAKSSRALASAATESTGP